jgi:FkbM family methyltransferase
MQFGPLTLKHCKYGWMLFAGPIIGKCFELYGEYSEAEVAMMRGFVREGGTVIDVGANIGDLTVPLARMTGPSGRVFAIESHPENFNVLCANLALNGIRNVKPINAFVATSDAVDTSSAVFGPDAFTGSTWQPRFIALDALEIEACDLLKVDVDGKELDVLRSGAMQIERFRPTLYFENDVKDVSAQLLSFVANELGYRLYWHLAPVFQPDNFFGNPVNHWAPKNICSLMMLGIPSERKQAVNGLSPVVDTHVWWEGLDG